ncbi:MAG: tandem-95 repeat protein [Bacteroidetes bacterium]|nr:tandem-95 repeat protein [Bacteroidota bacterium]
MRKRFPYILYVIALMVLTPIPSTAQSVVDYFGTAVHDSKAISVQNTQYRLEEICHNGIDDDGDGLIDCEDGDCEQLLNGGFENIPLSPYPGSSITFPPYPTFISSWAAVNIDGEVFYSSTSKPAAEGSKYASLLQNAGANPRQPWSENSWNGGGYDRFLFLAETKPLESYNVSFSHAADNRYNYLGNLTLVQIQSMETDYYYDTLITTPGLFDWQPVLIQFEADAETQNVAILFSAYGPGNTSVVVDGMNFCGNRDHPVEAVDDIVTTPMDQQVDIDILSNDAFIPEENVTVSILSEPGHGTYQINPNGTVSYTPDNNLVLADSFKYEVCNHALNPVSCDAAWVYIAIEGLAPVAVDDIDSTYEGQALNIRVVANDFDSDNQLNLSSISFIEQNEPLHGTVQKHDDGSLTYAPEDDFIGLDQFSYVICDVSLPSALRDTAVVSIHVIQEPETAVTDTFQLSVVEDESIEICAGVYFEVHPDGGLAVCGPGESGYMIEEDDGCATYFPKTNHNGVDVICLVSCDGSTCDTSIFIIDIIPANDRPFAEDDRAITLEDHSVNIAILSNDFDVDGNVLMMENVSILDQPDYGSVVKHPSIGLIYNPEQNYIGNDTITYLVCDNGHPELCDWATVIVQVIPQSDTLYVSVNEDSQISLCSDSVVNLNDSDMSGIIFENGETEPNSTITTPCFDYKPDRDFNGLDTVLMVICYKNTLCDTIIFVIDVLPINDAPLIVDDLATTGVGNSVLIPVTSNDSDPQDNGMIDEGSLIILEAPHDGYVSINNNGVVEYIPNPGFEGTDSFSYRACDLGWPAPALCGEASVHVEVVGGDEMISCMIPEAFSPNGDGLYDQFRIPCTEYYPDLDLFVYDRFGNQMFQSTGGYQNDWDGTVQHTGRLMRDGTYYWVVRFNDGHTKDRAGHVLIWR